MRTPAKQHSRAERLREHAATVERARAIAGAMAMVVHGREVRTRPGETPLEVSFSHVDVEGRSLPAAVWVALRRNDVDAAVDAMTAASQTQFVVEEREVVGQGYRLQSVQDTLPLPESQLLIAQLGQMLDVPADVLNVIAEWGPDDPRAASEIDELLDRRFGDPDQEGGRTLTGIPQLATADDEAGHGEPAGTLTLSVAEAAQVLRLDDEQLRALTILVRNAAVTLTPR